MVEQPGILLESAKKLVHSPKLRQELALRLHENYHPHAAKDLAEIIMNIGDGKIATDNAIGKEAGKRG